MNTLLSKCALGMALLVSIAAAPFSGSDLSRATEEAIPTSGVFSAAMLDNSKARWAREGLVSLVEAGAAAELPAIQGGEEPPPGETTGGATQCPVVHTQCPPQPTTCPIITTHCPVHETVCKTTECPQTQTICPVNPTVCEATECPVNDTFCPAIGTLCPAIPTVCPLGPATTCPAVATQCPPSWTTCPARPTKCPVNPTVCEWTKCPAIETLCPYTPWCDDPPICGITFDAGPPAGFVAPLTAAPGSDGRLAARGELPGVPVPMVTFLPAVGG